MKKGFTLIELLAVIVVLAVVSLIAIPQTSRVIKRANLNAAMLGAESYAHAVELYSVSSELKGLGSINDGIYEIGSLNINAKGKTPKSGVFTVKAGRVTDAKLCVNDYSVDVKNNHAKISKNDYCTGSKYTVTVYSDSKALNTSTDQKKFTINKENKVAIVCNNGATPIVNGETLYVMPAKENAECFVDNTLYQAIVHADKTKSTIEIINDSIEDKSWTLNDYKDVTIDLNGYKIRYNSNGPKNLGYINGKLTINGDEKSLVESSDNLFNIADTGSLVINGGNYKSVSDVETPVSFTLIVSSGNLTINGGNFEAINMSDITSAGQTVINGGKFYSERLSGIIVTKNSTVINGGEFISNSSEKSTVAATITGNIVINNATIRSKGNGKALIPYGANASITINNAYVYANTNTLVSQEGKLIINNVYAESEAGNALYATGSSATSTTIHGGIFISKKGPAIALSGTGSFVIDQKNKPVYISMKSLNSDKAAIINSATKPITIKGSKADKCTNNYKDTKSGLCIYSEGNKEYKTTYGGKALVNYTKTIINIDGGTYYGGHIAIHNSSTGGIINIKNAELLTNDKTLYDWAGSTNICSSTLGGTTTFDGGKDSIFNYKNLELIDISSPKSVSLGTINASYAGSCNEELAS